MTDYEMDKDRIAAEMGEIMADNDEIAIKALESAGYVIASKKWYTSKTFWVNVLVIVAGGVAAYTGYDVDPGLLAMGLGGINLGLRAMTGESLTK